MYAAFGNQYFCLLTVSHRCAHIYNADIVSFYKNIYIFINGNLIYPGFSPLQNVNIIDG